MDKEMNKKLEAYKARLIAESTRPPAPQRPREELLRERLEKTEVATLKTDERRIGLLIKQAELSAKAGDYDAVYALSLEIGMACRTRVLGLRQAHPILPSRESELPPALEAHTSGTHRVAV